MNLTYFNLSSPFYGEISLNIKINVCFVKLKAFIMSHPENSNKRGGAALVTILGYFLKFRNFRNITATFILIVLYRFLFKMFKEVYESLICSQISKG